MKEREARIARLRLEGQRREIMEPWRRELSSAIHVVCSAQDFLSLQETEALKAALYEKLRARTYIHRENWALENSHHMFEYVGQIGEASPDMTVCLFSNVDSIVGAVRVPARCLLKNAKEVWNLVGEDLAIVSRVLDHGLCLGLEFYDIHGTPVPGGLYEVSGWGVFGLGQRADQG